jgi:hypothetical protein
MWKARRFCGLSKGWGKAEACLWLSAFSTDRHFHSFYFDSGCFSPFFRFSIVRRNR